MSLGPSLGTPESGPRVEPGGGGRCTQHRTGPWAQPPASPKQHPPSAKGETEAQRGQAAGPALHS